MKRHRCAGFTLVELLTTIGIIGILLALSFPAFKVVREAARRSTCSSNLRQVAMALHAYEGTGGGFPAAVNSEGGGFLLKLLVHLDQPRLHDEAKYPIESGKTYNDRLQYLSESRMNILLCPSHFSEDTAPTLPFQGKFATHYVGMAGPVHAAMGSDGSEYRYRAIDPKPEFGDISLAGVFAAEDNGGFEKTELSDIADGTSNTIALGEISGAPFDKNMNTVVHRSGWAFGADFDDAGRPAKFFSAKSLNVRVNQVGQPINTQAFNSNHTKGTYFAYADASVHYVDDRISVDVLKMYASVADAEQLESLEDY